MASLAHVVKYSYERMEEIDLAGAACSLRSKMLGAQGLRLAAISPATTEGWQQLAGFDIPYIADAAGAGDWCTAGAIHVLGQTGLRGFQQADESQIREALRFGQALAAWNCGFTGARGGMYEEDKPTMRRIVERITAGVLTHGWNQREPRQPSSERTRAHA